LTNGRFTRQQVTSQKDSERECEKAHKLIRNREFTRKYKKKLRKPERIEQR
jgi:hypothetical protein